MSSLDSRATTGSPDRELSTVLGRTEPLAQLIGSSQAEDQRLSRCRDRRRAEVFQLKVTLNDNSLPIWRRVLCRGNSTLDHLHEMIQAAFGWWNCHLHEFEVGRTREVASPDPDEDSWASCRRDERRTRLDAIASPGTVVPVHKRLRLSSTGIHRIVVEKARTSGDRERTGLARRRAAGLPTRGLRRHLGVSGSSSGDPRADPTHLGHRRTARVDRPPLRPRSGSTPPGVRGQLFITVSSRHIDDEPLAAIRKPTTSRMTSIVATIPGNHQCRNQTKFSERYRQTARGGGTPASGWLRGARDAWQGHRPVQRKHRSPQGHRV